MSSVTSFENALERDYTLFLEEDDSFLIISRDKERTERFYVSPFLLSYVSPVFRQLLSQLQGEKGYNTTVDNRSLELKQSPIVVEHFLRHIDPTLPTPELNHETVVGVLELAELYKVKSIIRWFEEVSVIGCVDVRGVVTREAFVQKHPLLVLGLSCRLQLHKCVQMAMHELVICHSDKYKEDTAGISLDHRLVTHCRRLRDDLSNVYSALVYQLASHELSNKGNIKDSEQVTCMRCTVARAQWIHGLMSVTINHPRWSEFLVAYANTGECSACKISWANHMSRTLSRWKGTLAARQVVEPSLPEVPAWVIESWAMY